MISDILSWVGAFAINTIAALGYSGVTILMALESACVPIPSEVIMPFSGYLVSTGRFSFWLVVWWGAAGNLLGSILAYFIGYYGGRHLVEKYGKYLLISARDIETADRWFSKYGSRSVFFSRFLPVVRTFITLPAGIVKMDFKKFCLYTFAGSIPWSIALAYIGLKAGENWDYLKTYFHKFDLVIVIFIVLFTAWWIGRHIFAKKKIS